MSRFVLAGAVLLSVCAIPKVPTIAAPATSQPTTAPPLVDVKDKAALTAKQDHDVILQGMVDSAEWSKSGQVMNITFKDAENVMCVVFVKKRAAIDKAFGGNAAETWNGATLQVTGKLVLYTGRLKALKNKLQVIIDSPDQVKIVQAAPTTAPSK